MTSQSGKQTIIIHILINISTIKGKQTINIWSVNRIQQENYFFLKNHAENEAERLVLDLFF